MFRDPKTVIKLSTYVLMSCLMTLMISAFAFAQELPPVPEVTNDAWIQLFIASINGIKGATTLAIIGIVVKLIVALMGTPMFNSYFKKLKGSVKLTIVSFLTIVSSVASLMTQGMTFTAAILYGATLTSILVFINQVYVQFIKKKDEVVQG